MFKIVEKKSLNPTVSKITVEAPLIAKKAEPPVYWKNCLRRTRYLSAEAAENWKTFLKSF